MRLFALCLITLVALTHAADETKEPTDIFSLEVDGVRKPIDLDKPFEVSILGTAKSATLRVKPYRVFENGGVRFHFPREFSFDSKPHSPGLSIWRVVGSGCKITIQKYPNQPNPEATRKFIIKSLTENFDPTKTSITPTLLKLKSGEVKGDRLVLPVMDMTTIQELFSFQCGKGTVLLNIQFPEGRSTPELKSALEMLNETFAITEK